MTTISTRRRLAAALLLPFVMVLAGCGKFHAEFDVQSADTMNVSYDFALDEDLARSGFDTAQAMCDSLVEEISVAGELAPDVEAYEEGGQFGCLMTGVMNGDNLPSDITLEEVDGEIHLSIAGLGSVEDLSGPGVDISSFDFRTTFTFPGEVIESSGGQVEGSTVTYTDPQEFASGVDIRAEAGGFPWLIVVVVVVLLGGLLLLLLAVAAFFVIRARRNKSGGAGPPAGYGAAAGAGAGAPVPPAAPQSPQAPQAASPPPRRSRVAVSRAAVSSGVRPRRLRLRRTRVSSGASSRRASSRRRASRAVSRGTSLRRRGSSLSSLRRIRAGDRTAVSLQERCEQGHGSWIGADLNGPLE
ncbi:LppM family (lipo)protein [Brachybacterium massiliense]|uniref:LppM family (lipo)protein n=1 Tax=Brachybacterium massiliense TaxID=1755098 RepID=UPI001482222C|nr:hypothetical protein [Brachybacterium massiliense]